MARNIKINREQAEWLVDLLEELDPREVGTWRVDLSERIRSEFGMYVKSKSGATIIEPMSYEL